MDRKTDIPDSDRSARKGHSLEDTADLAPDVDLPSTLQTSNKTGKHSSAEKLSASRPEYGESPGAKPVDGAFGNDEISQLEKHPTGRNAGPGTNQFQCPTCGRFFNTQAELGPHEIECSLAKAATR